MQEAATKFGYGLFHFNQLNSKTKEKPYIFQCENVNRGEKVEYQAFLILKGTIKTPLIVTRRIMKKCRNDLMNYQIDSDVFENSEEDLISLHQTVTTHLNMIMTLVAIWMRFWFIH